MTGFEFNALSISYKYLAHYLISARFTGVLVAQWLRAAEETGMGEQRGRAFEPRSEEELGHL